jgi:hypothetical protein
MLTGVCASSCLSVRGCKSEHLVRHNFPITLQLLFLISCYIRSYLIVCIHIVLPVLAIRKARIFDMAEMW